MCVYIYIYMPCSVTCMPSSPIYIYIYIYMCLVVVHTCPVVLRMCYICPVFLHICPVFLHIWYVLLQAVTTVRCMMFIHSNKKQSLSLPLFFLLFTSAHCTTFRPVFCTCCFNRRKFLHTNRPAHMSEWQQHWTRDQTIEILYLCVGGERVIRQAGVTWPVTQPVLCAVLSVKLPGRALPGGTKCCIKSLNTTKITKPCNILPLGEPQRS